jgi:hypothetical protein
MMAGHGRSEVAKVTAARSPWSPRDQVRERGGGEVVWFDRTGSTSFTTSLTSGPHLGLFYELF